MYNMKMNELFTFIAYHFVWPDVYNAQGSTQVHELVPCVDDLGSFFRVQGSNPTVDGFFNFTFSASAAW